MSVGSVDGASVRPCRGWADWSVVQERWSTIWAAGVAD